MSKLQCLYICFLRSLSSLVKANSNCPVRPFLYQPVECNDYVDDVTSTSDADTLEN